MSSWSIGDDSWRTRFDEPHAPKPPSAAEVATAALARIIEHDEAVVSVEDKLAMYATGVLVFGRETHCENPGHFRLLIWREQNV